MPTDSLTMARAGWPLSGRSVAFSLLLTLLLAALWATGWGAPAHAQGAAGKRVALVVGVSNYDHAPRLNNPVNDAREVARRLQRFGFDVDALWEREKPVTKVELDAALLRLRERAVGADAVVVYFAGHGIELGGQNYLLPANARLLDERDVRREAVALDDVLAELQSSRPGRVNLVILDACRENPFRNRLAASGRSVSRGLGRVRTNLAGTLIAYATTENDVASDGGGGVHSPYTRALLDMMDRAPHLEIGLLFRRVRASVMQATNNNQQPWEYGSLVGEFYLAPPPALSQAQMPAPTPAPVPVPVPVPQLAAAPAPAAAVASALSPGQVVKDCSDCPELVVVGAGSFTMGSPAGETDRTADEGPQRTVTIGRAFALGRYEVTVGEFRRFVSASNYVTEAERNVGAKGCYAWDDGDGKWEWREGRSWRSPGFEQKDQQPAVCVSWNDAQAYLRWLSQKTGQAYRLPSEAEWEYAARAGSRGSRPWGEDPKEACRHGNVADQSRSPSGKSWNPKHECNDGFWYTAPVGTYAANRFGVYDMMGNAWEWTQDVWHENYNGAPTDGSVWSAGGDQARRVLRGGSWVDNPLDLRSANRDWGTPDYRSYNTGFRIARTL